MNHARPRKHDIYGGRDPIDIPAYAVAEAAHHLQLPKATVRSWVAGRDYATGRGVLGSFPSSRSLMRASVTHWSLTKGIAASQVYVPQ